MGDRFGYLGQALLGVLKDDVDAGCLGVARDQVSAKERFRERDGGVFVREHLSRACEPRRHIGRDPASLQASDKKRDPVNTAAIVQLANTVDKRQCGSSMLCQAASAARKATRSRK